MKKVIHWDVQQVGGNPPVAACGSTRLRPIKDNVDVVTCRPCLMSQVRRLNATHGIDRDWGAVAVLRLLTLQAQDIEALQARLDGSSL